MRSCFGYLWLERTSRLWLSAHNPEKTMMNIQLAERREEAAFDDCRLQSGCCAAIHHWRDLVKKRSMQIV